MHTSIGTKLFICKLDYCLKVDEPSTDGKKGICVRIYSKFSRYIMPIQYIMSCKYYCIDETMIIVTKKVSKHIIVRAILCLSFCLYYTQCHFQQTTSYSKSSQMGARMTELD